MPRTQSIHTGNTPRSPYWAGEAGRAFYVTIKRGVHPTKMRRGILLGPYDTHQQALDNVQRGADLACNADPAANFDAFGTCSAPRSRPLKPVFALVGA